MNRDPNKELGLYQSNDGHFIDYGYKLCPEVGEFVRAPLPDFKKPFFACLGAAQTLGRFVKDTYPELLAKELGLQSLNLGRGGVGPEYYLQRPALLETVNKAEFVVLQVMSGRSVSNSIFKDKGGLNHFTSSLFEGRQLSGKLWKEIYETSSSEYFQSVLAEQRGIWLDKMQALIRAIKKPVILLYYSHFKPPEKLVFNNFDQLWKFPQLIDKTLIEVLKKDVAVYFEYYSNLGMPQKLLSDNGASASVKMGIKDKNTNLNKYYPSPEMNADLAIKLAEFLKVTEFSLQNTHRKSVSKAVDFNRLLKPWVHPNIQNFLKSLDKSDLLIFDAFEAEFWLDQANLQCLTASPHSWREVLQRNKVSRVVIASTENEKLLKYEVTEFCSLRNILTEVKGIYSDIIFNWSFRVKSFKVDSEQIKPVEKYVVLCTPRSGSTVLCDLLEKTGAAGQPKEHLTRPVFEALKASAFSFDDWYTTLQNNVLSDNLVFGTKIITERLEWLRSIYSDNFLHSFFGSHKVLKLTRGSVAEQAVSKWFAQLSNKWHVKDKQETEYSYHLVKSYNFNAIYKIYNELKADEVKLNEQINTIFGGQALSVEYSDLISNTSNEMYRITKFLDVSVALANVGLETDFKRHDVEAKDEILEIFLRDLASRS